MRHRPHLYLPGPWGGDGISLPEDKHHHLVRVLRLGLGDAVSYTDGKGLVGVGQFDGDRIERGDESSIPRPSGLTVAVAPPDSRQRSRFVVEKLAELGAAGLEWVTTRRGEGRPPPKGKADAWAYAALEQSRGAWAMSIGESRIDDLPAEGLVVADPAGADEVPTGVETLLVGPEGGLEEDEAPATAYRLNLGTTVLRVETAAVVGTALVIALRRRVPPH